MPRIQKIIIVACAYRTGGTWLMNAIRLSIINAGFECPSYYYKDYIPDRNTYCILKAHAFLPELAEGASFIFTSYRAKNGIIASMKRRAEMERRPEFTKETQYKMIDVYLEQLAQWNQVTDYVMCFNEIKTNPAKIIYDIADTLGIVVDCSKVLQELDAIKIPQSGYDTLTLFHAGHITWAK